MPTRRVSVGWVRKGGAATQPDRAAGCSDRDVSVALGDADLTRVLRRCRHGPDLIEKGAPPGPPIVRATSLGQIDEDSARARSSDRIVAAIRSTRAASVAGSHHGSPRSPSATLASWTRRRAARFAPSPWWPRPRPGGRPSARRRARPGTAQGSWGQWPAIDAHRPRCIGRRGFAREPAQVVASPTRAAPTPAVGSAIVSLIVRDGRRPMVGSVQTDGSTKERGWPKSSS